MSSFYNDPQNYVHLQALVKGLIEDKRNFPTKNYVREYLYVQNLHVHVLRKVFQEFNLEPCANCGDELESPQTALCPACAKSLFDEEAFVSPLPPPAKLVDNNNILDPGWDKE